jgi:hypothetical protein
MRTHWHPPSHRWFRGSLSRSGAYGNRGFGRPVLCCAASVRWWPGAGAAPSAVESGRWGAPVVAVMWPTVEGRATPRRRPQSKQVPPWRPRSSVAASDPIPSRGKKTRCGAASCPRHSRKWNIGSARKSALIPPKRHRRERGTAHAALRSEPTPAALESNEVEFYASEPNKFPRLLVAIVVGNRGDKFVCN